jgi:hypothetical protein
VTLPGISARPSPKGEGRFVPIRRLAAEFLGRDTVAADVSASGILKEN